jgi:hypothetical protein
MCSTNWFSYTHTLVDTHENKLTEKFRVEIENFWFFGFKFVYYRTQQICCTRLWRVWRTDFQNITLTFHWFELRSKMRILFDMVDVVCAVDICALGWTAAQAIMVYLFICHEWWEYVWTNGWFAQFCHLLETLRGCRCLLQLVTRDIHV